LVQLEGMVVWKKNPLDTGFQSSCA